VNSIRSELNSLVISEFRSRKASSAGLFSILLNIFLVVLCASGCEYLVHHFPNATLLLRSLAILFIGTRWRALGNMMHECAHGIFVEKPAHNTFFGHLISALELSSFMDYIKQHVSHHAYLGDPERDLDYKARRALLDTSRTQLLPIVRILLLSAAVVPLWLNVLRPVVWSRICPQWVNILRIAFLIFAIALLFWPVTREFAAIYLFLPYLTAYQWMKIFSDSADHLFLYGKQNTLERSRNHLLPTTLLNWIIFPRNDAYHLLHHLFPSMPTHHYPKAHKQLLQHPWYASLSHQFLSPAVMPEFREAGSRPK
jgi:fatty acid desaturase